MRGPRTVEPHATPAATRGPQPCPRPDHAITKTDSKNDAEHKGSNIPEQSKHLKYAVLGRGPQPRGADMRQVTRFAQWKAAAAAAAITMLAAACGSSSSTSASSATSGTANHQASSPAQSSQVSSAVCQDSAALQTPLTDLATVSGSKGKLKQVKADLKDAQAKLSTLTGDAHGAFSTQINALKSSLTTLQTAVNGDPGAGVSTAIDGVTQAESDLAGVLAQGGCIPHGG